MKKSLQEALEEFRYELAQTQAAVTRLLAMKRAAWRQLDGEAPPTSEATPLRRCYNCDEMTKTDPCDGCGKPW